MLEQGRKMYTEHDRRTEVVSLQLQRINELVQRGSKIRWFDGQNYFIKVNWNGGWHTVEDMVERGIYPELDITKELPHEDLPKRVA